MNDMEMQQLADQTPAQPQQAAAPAPMPQAQPAAQPMAQQVAYKPGIDPNELRAEDAGFHGDIQAGHIKPQTYSDMFAKKDTLGKIGTLFGLVVGGAGAGLTHQPNAVLEMMNREIQNDLEAQKKSTENKYNFAKLNLEQQQTLANIEQMKKQGILTEAQAASMKKEMEIKAYTLANMQMNRAALHSLVQQVNKMPPGSPQRQQAEQVLAFINQGVQSENFNLADRAATAGALANIAFGQQNQGKGGEQSWQAGQNVLRMSGMGNIADINESKHLPIEGVKGQASVALTESDRNAIQSGVAFHEQLNRFIDWSKEHSGDLNYKDREKGKAMAAELQGAYRQATKGGVYKEGEQNFISRIIDDTPTKFFNELRVLPSVEAVRDENLKKIDSLVKSKGFQGYEPPSKKSKEKSPGPTPAEGATGTFQGKPVIFKNGKWEFK